MSTGRTSSLPFDREPPTAPAAPSRRRPRRWPWTALPLAALALILYLVPLPYFVFSPGPARDVLPLIRIQGHRTYPSEGHFLLTSVYFHQANAYEIVEAWLDPAEAVVSERDVLAPGETQEENIRRGRSQMDMSKIDAAMVALTGYADYPDRHGPGVLVEEVILGTPAEGRLFAGDVILETDGQPLDDPAELGRRIRAAGAGHPIQLTVQADDQTETVTVTPALVQGIDHPVIGVTGVANFPFPLTIESGDIGGPSAGLMWTLGIVDLLTPGDLTGGRIIAGTGVIVPDGSVHPIGGVEEKVVAAERAGAAVFFVPRDNADAARSVAEHLQIVPISTYREAVQFLQRGA